MFRVYIASLPVGLHQEVLHPSAEDLDLDPDVFSDVEVALALDVAERRVVATYTARATARLECDRTLAMYDQPVAGDHAVLFTADAPPEDGDDVFVLTDDAVDLTEPVRDTLLLALPAPAGEPRGGGGRDPDRVRRAVRGRACRRPMGRPRSPPLRRRLRGGARLCYRLTHPPAPRVGSPDSQTHG